MPCCKRTTYQSPRGQCIIKSGSALKKCISKIKREIRKERRTYGKLDASQIKCICIYFDNYIKKEHRQFGTARVTHISEISKHFATVLIKENSAPDSAPNMINFSLTSFSNTFSRLSLIGPVITFVHLFVSTNI